MKVTTAAATTAVSVKTTRSDGWDDRPCEKACTAAAAAAVVLLLAWETPPIDEQVI